MFEPVWTFAIILTVPAVPDALTLPSLLFEAVVTLAAVPSARHSTAALVVVAAVIVRLSSTPITRVRVQVKRSLVPPDL